MLLSFYGGCVCFLPPLSSSNDLTLSPRRQQKMFHLTPIYPTSHALHNMLFTLLLIALPNIIYILHVYVNLVKFAVLLKLKHPGAREVNDFVAKITYFSQRGTEFSSQHVYWADHSQL